MGGGALMQTLPGTGSVWEYQQGLAKFHDPSANAEAKPHRYRDVGDVPVDLELNRFECERKVQEHLDRAGEFGLIGMPENSLWESRAAEAYRNRAAQVTR